METGVSGPPLGHRVPQLRAHLTLHPHPQHTHTSKLQGTVSNVTGPWLLHPLQAVGDPGSSLTSWPLPGSQPLVLSQNPLAHSSLLKHFHKLGLDSQEMREGDEGWAPCSMPVPGLSPTYSSAGF